MSSVAYNLWRKLEFMSRRLRHIDDVGKILEWTQAMTAINTLLKEVDIKEYRDDWRPWRERKETGKVRKMDIDEVEPAKGVKKKRELLPPLRSPTTRTKKIGIKDDGEMTVGDNDKGKKKIKLDHKAAVLEMLRESKDQQEPNKLRGKMSFKPNKLRGKLSFKGKRDEKKLQINFDEIRTALFRRIRDKEASLFKAKAGCDVLFHNLEDDLGFSRNRIREEKDLETFVIKNMFAYYKEIRTDDPSKMNSNTGS